MQSPTGSKFKTFEDLEVYQVAREFRKSMYGVSRRLPSFEKFELASQIRRASVSLTNNIAEGHGRYHIPDQLRFLVQARGSLEELIDDLNVCFDETYLPPPRSTSSSNSAGAYTISSTATAGISVSGKLGRRWSCTKASPSIT
jgi:four helix bundle protein